MLRWCKKITQNEQRKLRDSGSLTIEQRATFASQALDNPIMSEAFKELESRLMYEWRNTMDDQITEREIAFDRLKALEYVKNVLTGYINQALIEEANKKQREEEERWMMKQS